MLSATDKAQATHSSIVCSSPSGARPTFSARCTYDRILLAVSQRFASVIRLSTFAFSLRARASASSRSRRSSSQRRCCSANSSSRFRSLAACSMKPTITSFRRDSSGLSAVLFQSRYSSDQGITSTGPRSPACREALQPREASQIEPHTAEDARSTTVLVSPAGRSASN